MDKYLIVAIVVIVCIFIVIYTQRADTGTASRSFKDIVQKEFSPYKVIERNGVIVIGEHNRHDQFEERILIRIDPNQKKNIRNFGQRITFTYSKQPSIREMRQDFAPYL
ncbi:hypothetical protein LIS44_09075 [Acinetobacter haemolyticus]|jgi:hypothetical protein|uniref:hypothetical protein n=1 Tax=unclassified Acinetobacter TaxID=196816 RepID=UPI0015D2FBB2|nr:MULTISPECIES: hypothetical protein [unclassified Acinetobacter]QQN40490.1 hypothetical protein JFY49_06205 [Acinetobacter sp. CS-2]UDM37292.1 hypothetical protein LIS44_09075 [Acinetobacter haemolyticus]